jgi:ABC-type multidrug transport system fused ATPase/permease subunit
MHLEQRPAPMRTFKRLARYLLPYRSRLISTTILAGIAQLAALTVPALTGRVVDQALKPHDQTRLWLLVGLIALAGLVRGGAMFLRRLWAGRMSLDVEYDLRMDMYTHLQRLSHGFYDRQQTGQLMSRATSDIQAVRFFLGYGLIFLTQHVLTVVAVTVLLLWTNALLALLAFALMPVVVWVAAQYSRRSHPILKDVQQKVADVTTQAEENIVGVRVVKAFAQEDRETARFAERSEAVFNQEVTATRIQSFFVPLLEFLPQLGIAAAVLAGGLATIDGQLTLGQFTQFYLYLAMLFLPLRMLGMWIGQIQRAIASGERIFEVLDVEPEITDPPEPRPLPDGRGDVRIEGVTFGYDPERPVLRGLDLHVEAGRTVALIGRTGSGKTTVTSLIPRFYDPQAGRVLLDGADVRDMALEDIRRQVGIVGEDTFLFSTSVRENIAYGAPWATDEEVHEAARQAQAYDFITALPEGFDTLVGERGLTLSGGQRQRIAIARALLLDPRVLILDDATASVDASTEARIKLALRAVMRDRTTLIVAHRLSTIALADEIVVLEDGRVVARGQHDDLVTESPVYAEIWRHGLVDRTFVDLDDDRVVDGGR